MRSNRPSTQIPDRTPGPRRRLAVAAAGLLALVTVAGVAVAGTRGTTEAAWTTGAQLTVPSPRSDNFGLTAVESTVPTAKLNNSPGLRLTNQATSNNSWIDVRTVTIAPALTDSTNLMSKVALDYTLEAAGNNCAAAGAAYWSVSGVGLSTNAYTRPSSQVAGTTLTPGQSRDLCQVVRPNYNTATLQGTNSYLRNHAGRALRITATVTQRSEVPATWTSPPVTAASTYRVAMPPPVISSTNALCTKWFNYGELRWAWPYDDSDSTADISTPAVARAVIMRQNADGTWAEHRQIDPGWRSLTGTYGINSDTINGDDGNGRIGAPRNFRLRLFPYNGDNTRYVDSTWIVTLRENYDSTECVSQTTVPSTAVNMP